MGESVAKPLKYYQNNVTGTLNLLEVMKDKGITNFVFSSSATVYGDPKVLPITETAKRSCANPYGQSKLTVEYILEDLAKSAKDSQVWNIISLRYFNTIGADLSGTIGEDPSDIPNSLMPYISQLAVGKLEKLSVFGNDYDTVDGTGVRDYIHVADLAKGHVSALDYIAKCETAFGFEPINLGTDNGTSVLQLVNAFIHTTGQSVPTSSSQDEQGTLPLVMPVAIKPKICLAGRQNTTSSVCAWTHGVGKVKIPEGIMPKKTAQRRFLRHYDSHVLFTMLLNLLNPLIRLGVRGQ